MSDEKGFTRRKFVKGSAAAVTVSLVARPSLGAVERISQASAGSQQVPHRPLGKTGAQVSALGVGGYHLGSIKDKSESNELVARALDA
jgi:uncharacterized protein